MSVYTSPVPTLAQMHVETHCASPGTVIVVVAGEVDLATAPALHAALVEALTTYMPTVVHIDLSACTFLDCSGIRVLVAAHSTAQASGHQMWARHPQHLVRRVLELTGLLDVFTAPNDTARQNAGGEDATGPASPRTQTEPLALALVGA
jgi:anti-sigma B factor antagonist